MVNVVGRATCGILQHVFVALFHDRAGETLTASRIGLSLSARRLLPGLSRGSLVGRLLRRLLRRRIGRLCRSRRLLLWRLLRFRHWLLRLRRGFLREERTAPGHHPEKRAQCQNKRKRLKPIFHSNPPRYEWLLQGSQCKQSAKSAGGVIVFRDAYVLTLSALLRALYNF